MLKLLSGLLAMICCKHHFVVGTRVRRRNGSRGRGTVKGCPTPILPTWPEKVVVKWDKFAAEFDLCCNNNPKRDHVSPKSLARI